VSAHIPYVEAGLVYGCVAGLLNVLAMIDVYAWDEARALGLDPRTHEAPAPVGAAAPAAPAASRAAALGDGAGSPPSRAAALGEDA
jgi:hypothetical protein